jgi:hypothetical protein
MLIQYPKRKKMISKKKIEQVFVDRQQRYKDKEGFILVSLDESFFFYDSLIRRAWVED